MLATTTNSARATQRAGDGIADRSKSLASAGRLCIRVYRRSVNKITFQETAIEHGRLREAATTSDGAEQPRCSGDQQPEHRP